MYLWLYFRFFSLKHYQKIFSFLVIVKIVFIVNFPSKSVFHEKKGKKIPDIGSVFPLFLWCAVTQSRTCFQNDQYHCLYGISFTIYRFSFVGIYWYWWPCLFLFQISICFESFFLGIRWAGSWLRGVMFFLLQILVCTVEFEIRAVSSLNQVWNFAKKTHQFVRFFNCGDKIFQTAIFQISYQDFSS
jgi:hypothetical protein